MSSPFSGDPRRLGAELAADIRARFMPGGGQRPPTRFYMPPIEDLGQAWEVRQGPLGSGTVELWRDPGGNLPHDPRTGRTPLSRVFTINALERHARLDLPDALRGAHWDMRVTWGVLNPPVDATALGWRREPGKSNDEFKAELHVSLEALPHLALQTDMTLAVLGEVAPELRGLNRADPTDLARAQTVMRENRWREAVRLELRAPSPVVARAFPPVLLRGIDLELKMAEFARRFRAQGRAPQPVYAFPWSADRGLQRTATVLELSALQLRVDPLPDYELTAYPMGATWNLTTQGLAGLARGEALDRDAPALAGARWMAWPRALLLQQDFDRDQAVLEPMLQALYEPAPGDDSGRDDGPQRPPRIVWVQGGALDMFPDDTDVENEEEEPSVWNADALVMFGDDGEERRLLRPRAQTTPEGGLSVLIDNLPRLPGTHPQPIRTVAIERDASHRCASCGAAGAPLRCTGCRNAWYCAEECQRRDWDGHSAACTIPALSLVGAKAAGVRTPSPPHAQGSGQCSLARDGTL